MVWESSAYKAIVRQAFATHADLVVCGTHRHTIGARMVSESVDGELIRQCPEPLLIVKSRRGYQDFAVVAAVDPFHANAKPANRDVRLVQIGRRYARAFGGTLHIFHAYMPLVPAQTIPRAFVAPLIAMPAGLEPLHQQQVERAIDRRAQSARIRKRIDMCSSDAWLRNASCSPSSYPLARSLWVPFRSRASSDSSLAIRQRGSRGHALRPAGNKTCRVQEQGFAAQEPVIHAPARQMPGTQAHTFCKYQPTVTEETKYVQFTEQALPRWRAANLFMPDSFREVPVSATAITGVVVQIVDIS